MELKVDRSVLSLSTFKDKKDGQYWLSRTPIERLQAIQINRQAAYGKSNASGGLQRVLEVAKQK